MHNDRDLHLRIEAIYLTGREASSMRNVNHLADDAVSSLPSSFRQIVS
jgi:hypothetical protein